MSSEDVTRNVFLMLLCYAYIVVIIVISGKMTQIFHTSQKASRKFLHAMIGNLPFVIPFFTASIYPALVAAPFILITFIASPLFPFKNLSKKMKGLAEITEEGHHLGLVFYAVSYTVLALFFASRPYIIAAGILPMAYGDSAASLVGEQYGKTKYKLIASRSLEGSAAMLLIGFATVAVSLAFFSAFYPLSTSNWIVAALAVATVTTLIEALSPKGSDNLTVPAVGALTLLLLTGGIQLVLVVIDGLDASGKSTQAIRLSSFLRQQGRTVFLRIHPSDDTYFGARAKHFLYLRGKSAHFAAAFFYMLDVLRSVILYPWQKYDYIVFVRYLMGTAYLPSPLHKIAYHFFALIVPTSNCMFFLDVEPHEANRRIQLARERQEMFENLGKLEQVRHKALTLALADNWKILDASRPIAAVENEIRNYCFGQNS